MKAFLNFIYLLLTITTFSLLIWLLILLLNLRHNLPILLLLNRTTESTVENQLDNLLLIVNEGKDEIKLNRSLIVDVSKNQHCGYNDPCQMTIFEEIFDNITNQTYSICKKAVRPRGTPCTTACVRSGTCTGFIGGSEFNSNTQEREPFCNISSPYHCYGYCNTFMDCIKPNLLSGKTSFASVNLTRFLTILCVSNACVFNVRTLDDLSGGYGTLYSWYNKGSWENRIYPQEMFRKQLFFGYGADFCEYILYDKFDSASTSPKNVSSPNNNKGCFDYHFEWADIIETCVYQYKCSRPVYFDSIKPYQFSLKKKRMEEEDDIDEFCLSTFENLYHLLNNNLTTELSNRILNIQNILVNEDIENFLDRLNKHHNDLILLLKYDGNKMDLEHFMMNHCVKSTINPNGLFTLKPRTTSLTPEIRNEIQNSFIHLEKIGYLSIPSKYVDILKDSPNPTSILDLQKIILQN